MESVAIRQRGGYDFATHYDHLCALNNTCPLPAIKAHLAQRQLDINADRIRYVYLQYSVIYGHCTLHSFYGVSFYGVIDHFLSTVVSIWFNLFHNPEAPLGRMQPAYGCYAGCLVFMPICSQAACERVFRQAASLVELRHYVCRNSFHFIRCCVIFTSAVVVNIWLMNESS